jgi:hypothetical protein
MEPFRLKGYGRGSIATSGSRARTRKQSAVDGERGDVLSVLGVEVRHRVILLAPEHRDLDPVEVAQARHELQPTRSPGVAGHRSRPLKRSGSVPYGNGDLPPEGPGRQRRRLDLYGHLMAGSEDEAIRQADAYLDREIDGPKRRVWGTCEERLTRPEHP